ncbi:SPOR domain-containing protein [Thalassobellus suaedae]|uniref:SPOR domain-containing protein n=1 Tax=Thalassobellus suaedae TaxID=3074124 RepID=A0ABY9Y870_9FLAO|nr:SPOR domain-containing protein [Flavobacteriaceae bacterium HL-DH14]WNH14310.1 SPOR domain-containing protein [Flavobacteriaceae bacterium HL-DH10]
MKILSLKISALAFLGFIIPTTSSFSQEGTVNLNQDKKIETLLNLKKEINKSENNSDRYKIQIYNGNRSGAQTAQKEFKESFTDWASTDTYEPPNFKIWVGNFRTRLEADRALKRIKIKFPSAFIFKPLKKKD